MKKMFVGLILLLFISTNVNATIYRGAPHSEGKYDFESTNFSDDILLMDPTNDGNPAYRVGASNNEEGYIQAIFDSGTQDLDYILIGTTTQDATADEGRIICKIDGTEIATIDDGGIDLAPGLEFTIDGSGVGGGAFGTTSNVTSNSSGTYSTDDFVFGSDSLTDANDANKDSRFLFDKSQAAFRAGEATSTEWDNPGYGSFSVGYRSSATGDYGFSGGRQNTASNSYAVSLGYGNTASASSTVAIGNGNTATSNYSMALGYNCDSTTANGNFAAGMNCTSNGGSSIAMGSQSDAVGPSTVAIGSYAYSSGTNSFAFGHYCVASGSHAYSFGHQHDAEGDYSILFGLSDPPSDVNLTDNNTMAIMGGEVGIKELSPTEELEVEGTVQSDSYDVEGGSGSELQIESITEEVTVAVGEGDTPTVTTTGDLAPANSLIYGITARITEAPGTGASSLAIGITGGGAQALIFQMNCSTVDTTANSAANNDGTQLPLANGSATTLTLDTDADVATDDMEVRITVYYMQFIEHTS